MQLKRAYSVSLLILMLLLSACAAPVLLLSPQGQLMWALLKPLVGLDPNEVNLLQQPLIQQRMQPLLGERYQTAVTLLQTAQQIQQEGPLFYLVSQHTPIPDIAEKAGFVWNAETNQMAVMLVSGGVPQIFAEQVEQRAQAVIPQWPAELIDYTDPAKLRQKAIDSAKAKATTELGGLAEIPDVEQVKEQVRQQAINVASEQVNTQISGVEQLQEAATPTTSGAQSLASRALTSGAKVVTSGAKAVTSGAKAVTSSVTSSVKSSVAQTTSSSIQKLSNAVTQASQSAATEQVSPAEITQPVTVSKAQDQKIQQKNTSVAQSPLTLAQQKVAEAQQGVAAAEQAIQTASEALANASSPAAVLQASEQLKQARQALLQAQATEEQAQQALELLKKP